MAETVLAVGYSEFKFRESARSGTPVSRTAAAGGGDAAREREVLWKKNAHLYMNRKSGDSLLGNVK